jgi:adenylate cyclase
VNTQYHTGGILISEYTKEKIGDEFICRALDRVRVVGINTPVRIYELLDLRSETGSRELDDLAAWEQAIGFFEKGLFAQAGNIFSRLAGGNPHDGTAKLYAEWCRNYIDIPPDDWDGVHNLTEK